MPSSSRPPRTRRRPSFDVSAHAIAPPPGSDALARALLAALRLRRPQLLQHLLEEAGAPAFARAVAAWSPLQLADALSLLPAAQRRAVVQALPALARRRWQAMAAPTTLGAPLRPVAMPKKAVADGDGGLLAAVRDWRWGARAGAGTAPA